MPAYYLGNQDSKLDRFEKDIGELLARSRTGGPAASEFTSYADNPVGFITRVLKARPWVRQIEIANALLDQPLVTVRSCHAAGKDWLAARLGLWWVYARRGLVVLTGPTASQVEEILMRKEIRSAFIAGSLPGELHIRALRPGGTGQAGILARTGSDVHSLTGLHEHRVLFIITEAQDPDIEHAWDAGFACTTGEHDRFLTLGNPTEPGTKFEEAHKDDSGWHSIKIAAADIPNVQQQRTVIPGLLTIQAIERFAKQYGTDSPFYISRVRAEFPSTSSESLIQPEWLDRSNERHDSGILLEQSLDHPHNLGVDPARHGPDHSTVCIRRGFHVLRFAQWRKLDTMQTAARVDTLVREILREHAETSLRIGSTHPGGVHACFIDEIGIGAGVIDRLRVTLAPVRWLDRRTLKQRRIRVIPFSAGRSAYVPERYRNMKSQSWWELRNLLEDGKLALPPLRELREELLAMRVRFAPDGKVEMEPKEAMKRRLGRSPDYADALALSLAGLLERPKKGRRFAFA